MKPNCLCGETLQGRPYNFNPVDCYQPISSTKAILIAKDNSPILRKTLVRYANSVHGIHEFDLVLDENNFVLGNIIYVDGEFKIITPDKRIIELPERYFNIWEPYSDRISHLYEYHVCPTVDLIDTEGNYVTSIFVSWLCYFRDETVVCKNKKTYMSFKF